MTAFIITLVAFIFVIGVLVFVHELGHYLAAKRVGIKVEEFAIGMGPRIWGFKRGETDYNIRLFPIGGYVKMLGEGDYEVHTPDSYGGKSPAQRLLVLVAGVFMNFILAVFLLYLMGMNLDFKYRNAEIPGFNQDYTPWFGEKSDTMFIISELQNGSPLEGQAQSFDIITKLNGESVSANDLTPRLIENEGKDVKLTVVNYNSSQERDLTFKVKDLNEDLLGKNNLPLVKITSIADNSPFNGKAQVGDVIKLINGEAYSATEFRDILQKNIDKETTFTLVNEKGENERQASFIIPNEARPLKIGITSTYSSDSILGIRSGFMSFIVFEGWGGKAFSGIGQSLNTVQNFFYSMGKLFERAFQSGSAVPVVDNVGGAISIFDILSKIIILFGIWGIIELMALFSLNLAILNILPIPALDGGHVVFTLLELVSRKRLPTVVYNYLTLGGFIFLMGLMVFITAIDIVKFPAVNRMFCEDGRKVGFICDLTVRN